jgi:hypothetical protein
MHEKHGSRGVNISSGELLLCTVWFLLELILCGTNIQSHHALFVNYFMGLVEFVVAELICWRRHNTNPGYRE